ncbi:MAG: flagellar hook-basal body complex protein [Gammaproteobacteria bacterium]|nr:flagellar hook-basal body complex protein [Gammaproteobacteria bacterium]MDH5731538.1 flagellar hook-basal body complex protein [Gammaproteobacteria bacterium]
MIGAMYTGMSGLSAYSKGLDSISNNISNLNTPGFKGSDLVFRDLFYQYQLNDEQNSGKTHTQIGQGVATHSTSIQFSQGELRDTGNSLDAAVRGNGFFIVSDGGQQYYSRSGQFSVDKDGYVVSLGSNYQLLSLNSKNNLETINIDAYRTLAPRATTEIKFSNNLSRSTESSTPNRHEVSDVVILDKAGTEHKLKLILVEDKSTPFLHQWNLEVQNSKGITINTGGQIRFQSNGTPEEGFNQYEFEFQPEGQETMSVKLFFGEPGSFANATSFSAGTRSDLAVKSQNGSTASAIRDMAFDREGVFTITYANGEELKLNQLAIAWFDDLQSLRQLGRGIFSADDGMKKTISSATQDGMGEIVSGKIELSNVEISTQFANLIITQRGFQASSQILTTANEMMQELIESMRK